MILYMACKKKNIYIYILEADMFLMKSSLNKLGLLMENHEVTRGENTITAKTYITAKIV